MQDFSFFVNLYTIIVDEIEVGKEEALLKVPLCTNILSYNYDLLELNILVHKFIHIHGIYISVFPTIANQFREQPCD